MTRVRQNRGASESPSSGTTLPDGSPQPMVIPQSPLGDPGHDPVNSKSEPRDEPEKNEKTTVGVIPHSDTADPALDPVQAKAIPLDAPGGKPIGEEQGSPPAAGKSRVQINALRRDNDGKMLPPGIYDIDDAEAKEFVRQGIATYIKVEPAAPPAQGT